MKKQKNMEKPSDREDHSRKKWEVTITEFKDDFEKRYKVTRRLPEFSVAETKIFRSKERDRKQLEEWLQ